MPITAIIDTDLSENDLDRDTLAETDTNQLHNVFITHPYLVLNGSFGPVRPAVESTSINLKTGQLYVGGLQSNGDPQCNLGLMPKLFEGPLVGNVAGQLSQCGYAAIRATTMFELERMFKRGPTSMIL